MRVLIVNTSEITGGAAVAANRLKEALNNNGVKAMMMVRDKLTDDITVAEVPQTWRQRWNFLWERFVIFCHLHLRRDNLFLIDIANIGTDITRTREFREADIIHLSWVNQGMLSLGNIRKILSSGKPVVWTMHDMWPATAICHYTHSCRHYEEQCGHCPLLPGGGTRGDLSAQVWKKKRRMLENHSVLFVTCSKWLAGMAKRSSLLAGQRIISIPNPIDTHTFCPMPQSEARQAARLPEGKRLILFVSQRVTDERKGISYFVDAINSLAAEHPEMREECAVAVLGGHAEDITEMLHIPVYPLGYVNDEKKIVSVYNSADIFVLPSLEDNLPNTIMEAMACGVPCVGFNTGGIPEMIDHQRNGYVAEYKSADDLARGIWWTLHEADRESLKKECLRKVGHSYSRHSVAMQYIEAYNQAMALRHYRL